MTPFDDPVIPVQDGSHVEYTTALVTPIARLLDLPAMTYNDWLYGISLDEPMESLERGDATGGMWGGSSIVFEVISAFDKTNSLLRNIWSIAESKEEARELINDINDGWTYKEINAVVSVPKTDEYLGLKFGKWVKPNGQPYYGCELCDGFPLWPWHPNNLFASDGWTPFDLLFPSFHDYVDAVSSDEGWNRWMDRMSEMNGEFPLCAQCPAPSNRVFCPLDFIYKKDADGNYTDEYMETCMGRAFEDLNESPGDWGDAACALLVVAEGGSLYLGMKALKCFKLGAPPAIKACLFVWGFGAVAIGATAFICWYDRQLELEEKFQKLHDAWKYQMRMYCESGEYCRPNGS